MIEHPKCKPRDLCIICGTERGTYRTADGMVCPGCMPADLVQRSGDLRKHEIIIHRKLHPSHGIAKDGPEVTGRCVSGDRSMAITLSDDVILADELNAQIRTADDVDMVVSFILMSGLNIILDSLRELTRHGRLRVITTAYMGTTEYEAVDELVRLPNTEVRMELDSDRNRLHAKSFIFHRANGHSTAYVGSANISRSALTGGEEWVIKVREEDVPLVIEDLDRGYEALWNSDHVRRITPHDRAVVEAALEKRGRGSS